MKKSIATMALLATGLALCGQNVAAKPTPSPPVPVFESNPQVLMGMAAAGQPTARWKEGLTFPGIEPMPWLKSAVNWYPRTEQVQPHEIRVTFMGTSPLIRPGQMGTSVYVELGNGKSFIFDFGPGSMANYLAAGVPLNQVNDIFLTHLHWDHVASVPYAYTFGAWGGRWHEKLRIYGPSGRTPELGTKYMMDRMKEMLTWHRQTFETGPTGDGFDLDVHEYNFADDGGIAYDQDGVTVRHWQQSHLADGASAYRLDWDGMSVVFTGDGRPNARTIQYAKGADLLITEIQPEIIAVGSQAMGLMPLMGRVTMDMAHNPAYAAGYLYNLVKPRLAMGTHVLYDDYSQAELYAEVRENYKGPFRLGAPDMVVVNLTRDKAWVRQGVVPQYPSIAPPQFELGENDGLVIPAPKQSRAKIQNPAIRADEIKPELYYPQGYQPQLITQWPTDKAVNLPHALVPKAMVKPKLEPAPAPPLPAK